jgi:hypothetical protein
MADLPMREVSVATLIDSATSNACGTVYAQPQLAKGMNRPWD